MSRSSVPFSQPVAVSRCLLRLGMAWGLWLATVTAAAAQVTGFDVGLFRTLRGADLTVVDGVVEFDPSIVEGGEDCAYHMGIEVRDSQGLSILTDSWRGVRACEEKGAVAPAERTMMIVETFQFAVAPGRFSVEVWVEPAGRPEAVRRGTYELVSLEEDAVTSDLILGREVGFVDTVDIGTWTVRKGQVGIAADPYVVATTDRSDLAYYLEIYQRSEEALTGDVMGVIRRPNGDEMIRSRLAGLQADAESRPIAGVLSLAGLPPGEYALELEVTLADTVVTRSRGFLMAATFFQPTPVRDVAGENLRSYFWDLSDEELVELFDAVEVWLSSSQEQNTYRSLSPDGKRQFLVNFFEEVGPQFAGPGESALDIFLERIEYVNANFSERVGRGVQTAWRTDRGRIYMVRGAPTERLDRPFPQDASEPYDIWQYAVQPGFVYLFVDQTRFGNYRLIFSTDPRENSLPNWYERVGRAAVTDMERYFGIRVRS